MEQIKQKDLQKYKIGEDGIKVKINKKGFYDSIGYIVKIGDGCVVKIDDGFWGPSIYNIQPILHPLTDLYKQMENGEIPIVELAKIAFPHAKEYELIETDDLADGYCVEIVGYTDFDIAFWCSHYSQYCDFISSNADNFFDYFLINNQLQLFDWLYEHHFWLGDQSYFNKGLIIDKNTLK